MSVPENWAADRRPIWDEVLDGRQFGTLRAAWQRSREAFAAARVRLSEAPLPAEVSTAAAFGSLARMELLPGSDLDVSVVTPNGAMNGEGDRSSTVLPERLTPLGYGRPKAGGIYADPIVPSTMCDPARRGRIDEEPSVFGKRIQLLLEGQPLGEERAFGELLENVLRWYGFGERQPQPHESWTYLRHDIERYHHSLAVRYQWLERDRPGTWRLLNVKYQFSRAAGRAGLLSLLGDAERRSGDPIEWMLTHLRLTPLERLHRAAEGAGSDRFARLAESYERFLTAMADEEFRSRIGDDRIMPLDAPAEYVELCEIGRSFARQLAALIEETAPHRSAPGAASRPP